MSDYKKEAKAASAAKMQRMGLKLEDGSKSFTDERGGSPFEGLNSGNAGKMPVTPSRFKRGGKVAHVEGKHAAKNLGKAPRKAVGGQSGVPLPPPRPKNMDKVPLPPVRSVADEYKAYHPDADKFLGSDSTYARGGVIGASPAQRKKVVGAMVARKKKEGLPTTPPKGFGVPRDIKSPIGAISPMKKGGTAKHHDEAEDKKLMHKILKPKAFKSKGGSLDSLEGKYDDHRGAFGEGNHMLALSRIKAMNKPYRTPNEERQKNLNYFAKSPVTAGLVKKYEEKYADQDKNASLTSSGLKRGGKAEMHHEDCSCKMCSGGRARKAFGGETENQRLGRAISNYNNPKKNINTTDDVYYGNAYQTARNQAGFTADEANPPENVRNRMINYMTARANEENAPTRKSGGRAHRATGGRTKGKTNVNIIISPQSGGQDQGILGAGVGMGQPPVPPMMPPMGGMPPGMPPMPPGGNMPPAGGLPPQLMAALAAKGGAGMPPMPRKSGGRVGDKMPKYQEKDYGSGSGLGRLVKRKWPVADGTE